MAAELDRGEAGASATREWSRRHDRHESQIRDSYPHVGGLILALSNDPQSTTAFAVGAKGERALGASLDPLRDEGIAVLHDRRISGTRANIDHLLIGPAGVFVVDAKHYRGKVEQRDRGGLFSRDTRLYVGGRDRSRLVAGMAKQVNAVKAALAGASTRPCPVIPALCFVGSEWGLFSSGLRFGDVRVVWPKLLRKLVRSEGWLTRHEIDLLERGLADALPPA